MKNSQIRTFALVATIAVGAYLYFALKSSNNTAQSIPQEVATSIYKPTSIPVTEKTGAVLPTPTASPARVLASVASSSEQSAENEKTQDEEFEKAAEENVRLGVIEPHEKSSFIQFMRTATESRKIQEQEGYL